MSSQELTRVAKTCQMSPRTTS